MRNRCVWLFLGLVFLAVRASGESLIEVDENGDEYELKRFYIQGRQLKGDGSQSQCVVTRRKRSGRALSSGSKVGENGVASVQVSSQTLNVESLPAGMVEHREGAASIQEVVDSGKRRYVALTGVHYEPHIPNDEGEYDDDEEDDDEDEEEEAVAVAGQSAKAQTQAQAQFVPAALALPLAQSSSQAGAGQQSSAAHLPQGVSVVANAASHANVAEDAGIVVVQSHQPPKVNPDTHAVFELKPIQADAQQPAVSFYPFVHPWEAVVPVDEDEDDYDEDDYDEEDYDDFYYGGGGVGYFRDQPGHVGLGEYDEEVISEENPITTTALWSTDGPDSDIHPVINQANKRPNQNKKNQNKNKNKNKNKNQNQNQKNRKNQKNKKRVSQKKRKEEAEEEEEHELSTQKRKKEKDQKNKQDKEQVQMDQSPIDVIKKPAAVASSNLQSSSASSSGSSSSMSSASNSSGSNSSDKKKKKKKKKKPSSSSSSSTSTSKRRTKKKKKQGSSSSSSSLSSGNRRRRPSNHLSSSSSSGFGGSSSSSSSSSSIGGYRRRRPQQSQQQKRRRQQQRRRKQQNNRRRQQQQQQQKRRRNRNKNRQFYGDEPIINCIYINKDPPTTTTPRPFWNILGRQSDQAKDAKEAQAPGQDASAAGVEPVDPVAKQAVLQAVRRNFGDFGGRKRTNLRFVS